MRYIQQYDTDEERQNLIESYKEKGDGITIVDSKEGETCREFTDRVMGLTNTKYVVEDAYTNSIYLYKYLEQIVGEGISLTQIVNIVDYLGNVESEEHCRMFKEIISIRNDIDRFLIDKKGNFKSRLLELEKDIESYHEELLKSKGQDELNVIMNNLKSCLKQRDLNIALLQELE